MDGHCREKRMNSFYILPDGFLCEEDERHLKKVLRLEIGDSIEALDGQGRRFLARIEALSPRVQVQLCTELPSNESPLSLTVYQGVPKADKLEWIAQKLTELGVKRLVPVVMERSVKRPEKITRLEKIAREAAKQCSRACPVEIAAPLSWKEALEEMRRHTLLAVPWEQASAGRLCELPPARDVGLLIGPEGGISPAEIADVQALGARVVTLGPRILRTETAAICAAAIAMSLWGDL